METFKTLHQQTLAETWFRRRSNTNETKKFICNESRNDTPCKQLKSPVKNRLNANKTKANKTLKSSNKTSIKKSESYNSGITDPNQDFTINDSECSQETTESRLKNKLTTSFGTLKTCESLSQKDNNVLTPDSTAKRLSISDVSSSVIKEELEEMYDNILSFDSIELTHNLSGVIADVNISTNINVPTIDIKTELISDEEKMEEEHSQNPLYIKEKGENKMDLEHVTNKRKRKVSLNKFSLQDVKSSHKFLKTSKGQKKAKYKSNGPKSKIIVKLPKTKKQLTKKCKFESMEEDHDVLSEELLTKLKFLKIQMQHDVPPQHKIENSAGSRYLTEEQVAQFENYGPLKKGPFTESEDEIIKRNWNSFCEIHEWDKNIVKPFLFMRHEGKYYITDFEERKNFVRFLANGLPWRSLYSIYYRFRNLYIISSVNNGQYSLKEDKIILREMSRTAKSGMSNKCAEVAKILNRKRLSVWQRYQKLRKMHNLNDKNLHSTSANDDSFEEDMSDKNYSVKKKRRKTVLSENQSSNQTFEKEVYTSIKWTAPVVKRFMDKLLEVTKFTDIMKLKNQDIDKKVWKKIEDFMSIDCTVLQNFWYYQLHLQLFCSAPIYLSDTKMKLIEYVHENQIKDLDDIDWDDACLKFDGMTNLFLCKLLQSLIKLAKAKINSSNINDIIEYLYEHHITELKEYSKDFILPKLSYKNGKIIYVDKGSERRIPNKNVIDPFQE